MLVLVILETYISILFIFNLLRTLDWYCMSPHGNALPFFINVRKCVGSLFTSGLLHNFTLVKVKEVCLTEWTLHPKKRFILLTQKCYCEVGIIIAIN